MTKTTTAQQAAQIRKSFKAEGIKAAVRTHNYSGGSSIYVRVISGNFDRAKQIANVARNVSYCEVTGEILSGGNTFVFVDWHDDAIDAKVAEVKSMVGDSIESLSNHESVVVLDGKFAVLHAGSQDFHVMRRTEDGLRDSHLAWGADGAVKALARILLADAA